MKDNPHVRFCAPVMAAVVGLAASAHADVFSVIPVADAFVTAAQPNSNFGAAGSLGLAAAGLPRGEFQSVMRFDTAAATAQFNTTYGAGNWTITAITLQLTATPPNNSIFNTTAAGQFGARWMANDSWTEGTGTPASPGASGITFASLPSFLSGSDESIGTFGFVGGTSGSAQYSLALTSGFLADASAGGPVSLNLIAADSAIAYLWSARSFGTAAARPSLSITAIPAPGACAVFMFAAVSLPHRRSSRRTSDRLM